MATDHRPEPESAEEQAQAAKEGEGARDEKRDEDDILVPTSPMGAGLAAAPIVVPTEESSETSADADYKRSMGEDVEEPTDDTES